MALLELSPAEAAFLQPAQNELTVFCTRLTRHLERILSARLRLGLVVELNATPAAPEAVDAPRWTPDASLATLWLTRRLGGQQASGSTRFVPPSLLACLDEVLAECWFDCGTALSAVPTAQQWRLRHGAAESQVRLSLPASLPVLAAWARETVGRRAAQPI